MANKKTTQNELVCFWPFDSLREVPPKAFALSSGEKRRIQELWNMDSSFVRMTGTYLIYFGDGDQTPRGSNVSVIPGLSRNLTGEARFLHMQEGQESFFLQLVPGWRNSSAFQIYMDYTEKSGNAIWNYSYSEKLILQK